MALIYVSADVFRHTPRCEDKAVGWTDEKGSEIMERTKYMDDAYASAMARAQSAAANFHALQLEVDRVVNENPPTLKSGV